MCNSNTNFQNHLMIRIPLTSTHNIASYFLLFLSKYEVFIATFTFTLLVFLYPLTPLILLVKFHQTN